MTTTYCYSDDRHRGREIEPRETADVSEVTTVLRGLIRPKQSVMTTPPGVDGYLDFYVTDDGTIQMEILDHCENDFAWVDIDLAQRVIEIAMTDTHDLRLRRKLDGLPITWLT